MSIWLFIWLFLSAALLYFFGWTAFIQYRQKRAWRNYAAQKKLRFRISAENNAPEITGPVSEYTVSLFTGEHRTPDQRTMRKLTAIEITLAGKLPFSAAVASGGMVSVAEQFNHPEELRVSYPGWSDAWVARGESRAGLQAYLTEERLKALAGVMKMKNAWVILVYRGDVALLRFDTPDPLDSEKKLDFIIGKMVETARVLELKAGEASLLKTESLKKTPKESRIEVQESDIKKSSEIELEE